MAISAITLAELAAGSRAAVAEHERGRRQDRLQWAASNWDPIAVDEEVARAYGRLYATMQAAVARAGAASVATGPDLINTVKRHELCPR